MFHSYENNRMKHDIQTQFSIFITENYKINPNPFNSQITKKIIKQKIKKKVKFRIRIQCRFRKKVIFGLGLNPQTNKNGS